MLFKKKEKPLTKKEKVMKYVKENSLTLGVGSLAGASLIANIINGIATSKNKKKIDEIENHVINMCGSDVLEQIRDMRIDITNISNGMEDLINMIEFPEDEEDSDDEEEIDEENPTIYSDPENTKETLAGPIAEALAKKAKEAADKASGDYR